MFPAWMGGIELEKKAAPDCESSRVYTDVDDEKHDRDYELILYSKPYAF